MARLQFLADIHKAQEKPPVHITDIKLYEDDGIAFTYSYTDDKTRRQEVRLNLIATTIDEYPDTNGYILYTDDSGVDPAIQTSLEQIQAIIDGMSVLTALKEISGVLHQALSAGQAENPIMIHSDPVEPSMMRAKPYPNSQDTTGRSPEASDFEDFADDSDDNFGFDYQPVPKRIANKSGTQISSAIDCKKIREDLRMAKDAGFKIGAHGSLGASGIVSVSIRVAKLGISQEAMRAWGISKEQYLVLLIWVQRGYRNLVQVKEEKSLTGNIEMRVGICNKYKPDSKDCFRAFSHADYLNETKLSQLNDPALPSQSDKLESLFIGKPLNHLLRDRFAQIAKFRTFGLSWDGAEKLYNDTLGARTTDLPKDLCDYRILIDEGLSKKAFPSIIKADHLDTTPIEEASLPLVAMQFVLRHFVRCTEFCLVCHCKVQDNLEALKPYVCSKQLCLYQFLALGIGPSIEWEVMSQPYVVDLLISLCYAQAHACRLKDFPLGISLKVPLLPQYSELIAQAYGRAPPPVADVSQTVPSIAKSFSANLNCKTGLLTPSETCQDECSRLTTKDWIALVFPETAHVCHYRVGEVCASNYYLTDRIPGIKGADGSNTEQSESVEVDCYVYEHSFDALPSRYRHASILAMLDLLPSVSTVRDHLLKQRVGHRDPDLMSLFNIPPASKELMRWIIASNRSCIVQVDRLGADQSNYGSSFSEHGVSGMQDWLQFRFAQGAPDKEQRFIDSARDHSKSVEHPTLFAWHGSPLHNWHSIIREGLNFDDVMHGRANGHGVYMSSLLATSIGYTNGMVRHSSASSSTNPDWTNSELKISMVISLQEVVNNPLSFVCVNPHFVVAQKEWIQTRYLFIKSAIKATPAAEPDVIYSQDPTYPLRNYAGENVKIPLAAVSTARRDKSWIKVSTSFGAKKLKTGVVLDVVTDDIASDTTLEEDSNLCVSDDGDIEMINEYKDGVALPEISNQAQLTIPSHNERKRKSESLTFILDRTKTDFVPGALDTSNIRILPQPTYATKAASAALMKALKETSTAQNTIPLHDLGFYIDENKIDNLYQWIVELHSFDKNLPLTKDMKQAGLSSIVLEILFTAEFPYSPPFVRVVKPRFLPFLQGGGGHVTEGGAICMELLTTSGWSAVGSIESVLLSIRLAMSELDRPARLLNSQGKRVHDCYAIGDAISAYQRACARHGWQVPKGMDSLMKLNW